MGHGCIQKTSFVQDAFRFVGVAESEKRWPCRDTHVQVAVLLNCSNNDSESDCLVRSVPDGEGNAATRAQYSMGFLKRSFGAGQMQHSEIQDDRIECGVVKRELLGVTGSEIQAGVTASRLLDHFGREVQSYGNRSSSGSRGSGVAGS